ncbi:MAG: AMP-binding protein [Bacteroidales bacterium]|nr:AMP-binding protein [Bacteroidales bacterium]
MLEQRNKVAINYKDIQYTYSEVLQISQIYADTFLDNCKPSKVLIFADNSPEWCFALYGSLRCEALVVPVDVQSTRNEVQYIIDDCTPDIIFTTDNKLDFFSNIDCKGAKIVTPSCIAIDNSSNVAVSNIPVRGQDATMFIIYTSGTTGNPKGVMLSYKNVMFNIDAVSKSVPIFKEESNVMILLPLHHVFPLIGSLVAPLSVGSTVYIAEGMNAEAILKTLNQGRISLIIGVPRLYDMLVKGVMNKINASVVTRLLYKVVKAIGSDSLSKIVFKSVHTKFGGNIEFLVSGGAALSHETATILKTLGFYVLEGYGMTEAAPMITFTRPGKRKIGYTGDPLPMVEVRIAENGEICLKGDNVMQGYYQRKEETEQILKDGWLHTGDIGVLDKNGLKITGRIKEIIVTSNGKNINPELLEQDFIKQSQYVEEIGIFLHKDVLHAAIRPNMSNIRLQSLENMDVLIKDEVSKFNLQNTTYKRIKQYHIISTEFPKTRLGKLQRYKLPSLIEKTESKISNEKELENKSEIYKLLKAFVEEETGYTAHEHDHFEIDLSMDSLNIVSLLAYIENSFDITLTEEQIGELNTLDKLSKYIENENYQLREGKISWKEILSTKTDIKLQSPGIIHWCVNSFSKIALSLIYRFRYKGSKNIPDGPCIIVANHRSALDGLLVTYKLPHKINKNTFFFAKKKHWKTKLSVFLARKNNIILMDINKNVRESLQEMSAVIRNGKNVVIFPEGTRSKTNDMNKFKETFAILSKELNVPIVPVAITGSERAVYHNVKIPFPRFMTRINVDVLNPVYPSEEQTAESICDKVADSIRRHLGKQHN